MVRPREFDVDEVLRQAMELFWEKGFDGTSFADIEARTGVKKASLFAAYGDKRSLFLKALAAYQEAGREAGRAKLESGPAREALRAWMAGAGELSKGECASRGCMQVNSIVELAPHDPQVAELVRQHGELLVDAVARTISRGQKAGELRTDVPARSLAHFLVSSLYGLGVAGKAGLPRREVDRVLEIALSALDAE